MRLIVVPFRAEAAETPLATLEHLRPAAIILIEDQEKERHSWKMRLRSEFGLTAAEAELALEIMRGDGREAAAARLGITVATVRTHLLHIFEKTGVHRQAELVRLLLDRAQAPGG
jgi:DNA-binding CsgD family transcriptional regulator